MSTSYHESFLKKILYLFDGVVISNVISIVDEDDEIVDNVVFFNIETDRVIGFYINGSNPFITRNHIENFDDFNYMHCMKNCMRKNQYLSLLLKLNILKFFFTHHTMK